VEGAGRNTEKAGKKKGKAKKKPTQRQTRKKDLRISLNRFFRGMGGSGQNSTSQRGKEEKETAAESEEINPLGRGAQETVRGRQQSERETRTQATTCRSRKNIKAG